MDRKKSKGKSQRESEDRGHTQDASIQEYAEKLKGVGETFINEFNMGKTENSNDGPPPNMKSRKLIFDSMQIINKQGAGDGSTSKDLARYVYVCGAGFNGQLGRKAQKRGEKKYANIPSAVSLEESVRQLSCGALHTAVVTDDGKVFTWGDHTHGQLGHPENYAMCSTPKEVYIAGEQIEYAACGQYHTVCISKSDKAYSFGLGKFGQLGTSKRNSEKHPCEVVCDDPEFKKLVQVCCGDRHTVFLTKAGRLFSCGSGTDGQLGHGNGDSQYVPKLIEPLREYRIVQAACGSIHTAAVTDEGNLFIWGFGEHLYGHGQQNFNNKPVKVEFKQKIRQIACGQSHILILTDSGDVYSWGGGEYGEIGQGAFKAQYKPVLVLLGKNIDNVSCGRYHSAALSNIGTLYTWGCCDNGQLGRAESSQDNFVKQACSVPKVVNSMTGHIIGSVSCGEHHTCVIASCKYVEAPEGLLEWGTLEEMEYEFKVNITSRHRGRGIPRKDVSAIRRWRRDEERRRRERKDKEAEREANRAINEVNKIKSPEEYRNDLTSKRKVRKNNADEISRSSIASKSLGNKPELQRKKTIEADNTQITRRKQRKHESVVQVSAKQAAQAHAVFHEQGSNLLNQMGQTLYNIRNPCIDGVQYTQEDMLKRKFETRKRFDKLKLITREKKEKSQCLEEELIMLREADDCTEIDSKSAQDSLDALKMRLNTVTIKINEAERNRRTYELNISNIKDESQETHKQVDIARRSLAGQEGVRKKIEKFSKYMQNQKELAQGGIKQFRGELSDWKNFLGMVMTSMAEIAKGQKENDSKQRAEEIKRASDMKKRRSEKKLKDLKANVGKVESEAGELAEDRETLEVEIFGFEEMFCKLRQATNKAEPWAIINKFELNAEIYEEYKMIRDKKAIHRNKVQETLSNLMHEYQELTNNRKQHTWREVDEIQEQLQEEEDHLANKMKQVSQITTTLEQLKEWTTSIITKYDNHLVTWDGVDDRITHAASREDIVAILESLRNRITTFRQIIQHQANGTEAIFKKKEM